MWPSFLFLMYKRHDYVNVISVFYSFYFYDKVKLGPIRSWILATPRLLMFSVSVEPLLFNIHSNYTVVYIVSASNVRNSPFHKRVQCLLTMSMCWAALSPSKSVWLIWFWYFSTIAPPMTIRARALYARAMWRLCASWPLSKASSNRVSFFFTRGRDSFINTRTRRLFHCVWPCTIMRCESRVVRHSWNDNVQHCFCHNQTHMVLCYDWT